jgi:hypothetical protein
MHVGLAPLGPSLEQVGHTCFDSIKGTPIFFLYKNQEIMKFVKLG